MKGNAKKRKETKGKEETGGEVGGHDEESTGLREYNSIGDVGRGDIVKTL
jgi:hypothetical protein